MVQGPHPPKSPNPAWTRSVNLDAPGQRHGQQPVSGTGVVKQDKSTRGSVDATKTRSDPQRVRMSSGARPIGTAKGKQLNTEALCNPPPPPHTHPAPMKTSMKPWPHHAPHSFDGTFIPRQGTGRCRICSRSPLPRKCHSESKGVIRAVLCGFCSGLQTLLQPTGNGRGEGGGRKGGGAGAKFSNAPFAGPPCPPPSSGATVGAPSVALEPLMVIRDADVHSVRVWRNACQQISRCCPPPPQPAH